MVTRKTQQRLQRQNNLRVALLAIVFVAGCTWIKQYEYQGRAYSIRGYAPTLEYRLIFNG